MSVVLFPLKIIFFVFAVIMKIVCKLLSIVLNLVSDIFLTFHILLNALPILIGVGGTITFVNGIKDATFTLLEGGVLIALLWIICMIFVIAFSFASSVADWIEDVGDWFMDTAKDFFI